MKFPLDIRGTCPSPGVIIQSISRLWLLCPPHNISKGLFGPIPSSIRKNRQRPLIYWPSSCGHNYIKYLDRIGFWLQTKMIQFGDQIDKQGDMGSTYLGFGDIEQLGHVCPFTGAEVLFELELLLQLKNLSSGECGARLLLPLRLSPRQRSLVPGVLHIDPILIGASRRGSSWRIVVTAAVVVLLAVQRLFALPQRHGGWRSRSGSAVAGNWLCAEETVIILILILRLRQSPIKTCPSSLPEWVPMNCNYLVKRWSREKVPKISMVVNQSIANYI